MKTRVRVRSLRWNFREYARYLSWPWMLLFGMAVALESMTSVHIALPFVLFSIPIYLALLTWTALTGGVVVSGRGISVIDFGVRREVEWERLLAITFTGKHLGDDGILSLSLRRDDGTGKELRVRSMPSWLWPKLGSELKSMAPERVVAMVNGIE